MARELPMTAEQASRWGTETMPITLADRLTHNGVDYDPGEEIVAPVQWVKEHTHLTQVGKNIEAYASSAFTGMGTRGDVLNARADVVKNRGKVDPREALRRLGIQTRGQHEDPDKLPRILAGGSPTLVAAANVRQIKQYAIEQSARAKDGGESQEESSR